MNLMRRAKAVERARHRDRKLKAERESRLKERSWLDGYQSGKAERDEEYTRRVGPHSRDLGGVLDLFPRPSQDFIVCPEPQRIDVVDCGAFHIPPSRRMVRYRRFVAEQIIVPAGHGYIRWWNWRQA